MPRRGSVQDVGPTLSHNAEVARLLEAGYPELEIWCKLSLVRDLRSVERHAQSVVLLSPAHTVFTLPVRNPGIVWVCCTELPLLAEIKSGYQRCYRLNAAAHANVFSNFLTFFCSNMTQSDVYL